GKFGAYTPESGDLNGFSSDFAGEAAFGHYFNDNFAAEFGVGYLQTSATFYDPRYDIFYNEDIDATFLEATAKAVLPIPYYYPGAYSRSYMDLYAGVGAGIYFANDSIDAFDFSQHETVGGFHILGGLDFNIERNFFLGLEAKYLWAKPFDTSLDGLIFTGNFGYRF
nr:outer membrane beta-barrel protein [Nitrospiraceae bacterium]